MLRSPSSCEEVRGADVAGALTPENPVTDVHVPAGSVRAEPWVADEEEGAVVPVDVVPTVACGVAPVATGMDMGVVDADVDVAAADVGDADVDVGVVDVDVGVTAADVGVVDVDVDVAGADVGDVDVGFEVVDVAGVEGGDAGAVPDGDVPDPVAGVVDPEVVEVGITTREVLSVETRNVAADAASVTHVVEPVALVDVVVDDSDAGGDAFVVPPVVESTVDVFAVGDAVVSVEAVDETVASAEAVGETVVSAEAVGDTVVSGEAVGDTVVFVEAVGDTVVLVEAVGGAVLVGDAVGDTVVFVEAVVVDNAFGLARTDGGSSALDGSDALEGTVGDALTDWAGGVVLGAAVEPEMTAGADRPPAVARLATMPRTTDPLAGTLVAEATTAWPSGVAETCVISWMPVATGVPAIAEAAEDPAVAAPEASACEPAAQAEDPALENTRRSAARTGAVSTSGMAAQAPFTAFVAWRARCSFARARRTRALAFTSVIPRVPATSS